MIRGLDPTLFACLFYFHFCRRRGGGTRRLRLGLVASGIWLYILSPVQTATMILAFGFLVQSYAVWVQRSALDWQRIWPLNLGSAFGIPLGIAILTAANPGTSAHGRGLRAGSLQPLRLVPPGDEAAHHSGCQPTSARASSTASSAAPPGLAGVIATIWCQLRGGPRDQQRAVFQPVASPAS